MKKNYLMAVCLFLVVMSGCGNKEQSSQQAEPVKVKVMTVVSSVRNETVRFSGTVQEENGSSLSFPLMGRVKSVKVDLGSRVRQGQLLATLDEVSMQNTYQAAKAALKQAEDAYQRMKELHEKGSLAEMKWVEVQSKLQQAQSMEAVARKNLTDCKLYAPFSGVIAEKSLGGRAERGTRCTGAETGIRRPAEGTDFRAGDGNRARGKRTESRDRGTGSEWNKGRRRGDGERCTGQSAVTVV